MKKFSKVYKSEDCIPIHIFDAMQILIDYLDEKVKGFDKQELLDRMQEKEAQEK